MLNGFSPFFLTSYVVSVSSPLLLSPLLFLKKKTATIPPKRRERINVLASNSFLEV